jgi:hypothetical protein
MVSNPYINYYSNQAGKGISGFEGVRWQRGRGFFGTVFKSAIMPMLHYLGKHIMEAGTGIYNDVASGQNILESGKTRFKRTAQTMAGEAAERLGKFSQTGQGKRKRRRVRRKTKQLLPLAKQTFKRKVGKKSIKKKTSSRRKKSLFL